MQEAVSTGRRSLPRCAATSSTVLAATRSEQGHLPRARALAPASPSCAPRKALAVLRGRDFVVPQDVKDLAGPRAQSPDHPLTGRPACTARPSRTRVARAARDRTRAGRVAMARPTGRGSRPARRRCRHLPRRADVRHVGALSAGVRVPRGAARCHGCSSLASMRGLEAARTIVPERPVAGDPLLVAFRVTNRSSLPGLQVTLRQTGGGLNGRDDASRFRKPRAAVLAGRQARPAARTSRRPPAPRDAAPRPKTRSD